MKRELSVVSVSVFTLIRTDTTLDHSQKAEKVCMMVATGRGATLCEPSMQVSRVPTRYPGSSSLPLLDRSQIALVMLEVARSRRPPLPEIVLWIAASRSPSESQTPECSDLLSRSRATFVIVAQRQPGKLHHQIWRAGNQIQFEQRAGTCTQI